VVPTLSRGHPHIPGWWSLICKASNFKAARDLLENQVSESLSIVFINVQNWKIQGLLYRVDNLRVKVSSPLAEREENSLSMLLGQQIHGCIRISARFDCGKILAGSLVKS
jgi:hypothetical protein